MQKRQLNLRITPVSIKYDAGLEENEPIITFDGTQIFSKFHSTLFHADSLAAAQK